MLEQSARDILSRLLADATGDVYVVSPSGETIEDLVRVATDVDSDLPVLHLLADERTLKDVVDDFLVASNAADLIAEDTLALRTAADMPENSLVITEDRVVALVDAGSQVGGLVDDTADFVAAARDKYAQLWDGAEQFSLRTPPITRIRETLESDIGAGAREDFDTILASLETARGDGQGLDEVTISLVVAARNEALLYDISKWGEDIGIASKATFSRTKTQLEEQGIIDTEKVPIDVGRPRLRLKFGDDRLVTADSSDLAGLVQSMLE